MFTDSANRALAILRDGTQFQWYVIPLLAFVFYVYTVEVEKQNWNLVLAGLAFWGMDWLELYSLSRHSVSQTTHRSGVHRVKLLSLS